MKDKQICRLFLCYRNQGTSATVAAAFKTYAEAKNAKLKTTGIECFYSGEEPIGNYITDIPNKLARCDYMIIFADKNITAGFLNDDGSVNESCVTAIEFCEAEKLRQQGKIRLALINIDGYKLNDSDASNIEKVFSTARTLNNDSVVSWTKLNENIYSAPTHEQCFDRLLKGVRQNSATAKPRKPRRQNAAAKETAACISSELEAQLVEYYRTQFTENMYIRLDDIATGDGDSDNQAEIEDTFSDLYVSFYASPHEFPLTEEEKKTSSSLASSRNFLRALDIENDSISQRFRTRRSLFAQTVLDLENSIAAVESKAHTAAENYENMPNDSFVGKNTEHSEIRKRNLLLLGRAGQGKTTLMQYLALFNWANMIKNSGGEFSYGERFLSGIKTSSRQFTPRITFKIKLAIYDKYTSFINAQHPYSELLSFDRYIEYLLWCAENDKKPYGTKNNADEAEALSDWIRETQKHNRAHKEVSAMLYNKPVLILFDGLDEVKLNRRSVIDNIKQFVRRTGKDGSNIITVTTTRKEKSEEIKDKDSFTDFELLDLDETEVSRFVKKYISAKWKQNSEEKIAEIMSYYERKEYEKLMQTPLEVTMICMVYNAYNSMPKSIEKLYDRYVTMYVQREKHKEYSEQGKKQESQEFFGRPYTDNLINDFLNAIGYELEYRSSGVTEEEAIEIAKRTNIDEGGEQKHDIDDPQYFKRLVDIVFTRLSFFDCDNTNVPAVYSLDNHHASVCEYLAARYFVENRSDGDKLDFAIRVLIEQERSPQHWGIFKFLLELMIDTPTIMKMLLAKLLDDCTLNDSHHDNASPNVVCALKSTHFGAKIATKLMCEERMFNDRPNYKKPLLQGALEILLLDGAMDSENIKRIISFAFTNGLFEHLYLSIEGKLSDNRITDDLIETIAYLAVFPDRGEINETEYPKLAKIISSGDYLDLFFGRLFDTQYFGDLEKSIIKDETILKALFEDLKKHGKALNVSLDSDRTLICDNKEKFLTVEFIRKLFIQPRDIFDDYYSDELFGDLYKTADEIDRLFIDSPYWQIVSTLERKSFSAFGVDDENLLNFYFNYRDTQKDARAIDMLVALCKKHDLPGTAAMFECIKDFNRSSFTEFVKNLSSGMWDKEFFALFGSSKRWAFLRSLHGICAHPTFVMVDRRLCDNERLAKIDECAELLFRILEDDKRLTLEESFRAFDDGIACRITMSNSTNENHIKLIDRCSFTDYVQQAFIFSGLEWKNRFPARPSDNINKIHGTYCDAIKDKDYENLRPQLAKTLAAPPDKKVYHVVCILNFLLAYPQCGISELAEYSKFPIKDYADVIKNELYYRYSETNKNSIRSNQYDLPDEQSEVLFNGCPGYKTVVDRLATLALESPDFFTYFKQAISMLISSGEFITNFDTDGLNGRYPDDPFLHFIISLKNWRKNSDLQSPGFDSTCGLIANDIRDCAKTDLFDSPQATCTVLLRFIIHNFKRDGATIKLVSKILEKLPTDEHYISVRKEAQDYLAASLKFNKDKLL